MINNNSSIKKGDEMTYNQALNNCKEASKKYPTKLFFVIDEYGDGNNFEYCEDRELETSLLGLKEENILCAIIEGEIEEEY